MQCFTAQLPPLMCGEQVWQSTKLMQLQGFGDFNKLLRLSVKHFYITLYYHQRQFQAGQKTPYACKISTFFYYVQWNGARVFIEKLWDHELCAYQSNSVLLEHVTSSTSALQSVYLILHGLWTKQIRLFERLHFVGCSLIVRFMNESDWTSDYSRQPTDRNVLLWLGGTFFWCTAACIQQIHTVENVISWAQAHCRGEHAVGLCTLKDYKGTGAEPKPPSCSLYMPCCLLA